MPRYIATTANWKEYGRRCHRWWMKKLGIELGSANERNFLAIALPGEVGELLNNIKKMWRDGPTPELEKKTRKEFADTYAYLLHLADHFGWDLDDMAAEKTQELFKRWPDAYEGPELDAMGHEL